ncbi:c-type cytochrome [Massilia horti]|uniref:C-type cytochrome n=1 Tax=Massilia horti TaxID=2562153 RepID=A0A4Y9SYJ7_9BURK|nr:c-type cytochrome [Massilia horti]TFW31518.1 c-type cytochrome [Massilia horti]
MPTAGNLQAGHQIATNGAPGGVAACASCHGAQGEGNAAAGFPRIAGQSAYYLGKQLTAYADGTRQNAVMGPIAKAMSAQQKRDVSAYYAELKGPVLTAPAAPPGAGATRALQLATVGDSAKRVQACSNCHGPGGIGEPPAYPFLAGQHASYLTAAMAAWKNGTRKTDPSGQMPHIAMALSDADIQALSAFFSARPPPPQPAAKDISVPAGSLLKPAEAAGGATQGAPPASR